MKNLNNYNVFSKNVLVRVDLNVPINNGTIFDQSKLLLIKSTVVELIKRKNKVFLLSHFGRPQGKFNKKYSLEFIVEDLKKIFSVKQIHFVSNYLGKEIIHKQTVMQPGEICLLENIRFHKGEEKNDLDFAKLLTANFDVFVNDAFSVSHRNHASIVGVTEFLPSLGGLSLLKEIETLNKLLYSPKKPITAIIGGSKISTKLKLLHNFIEIFDKIIIGGAMANTFLLSIGLNVGNSIVEKNLIEDAKVIFDKSKNYGNNIILPLDLVCSNSLKDISNVKNYELNNIPKDQMALDIGSNTIKLIKSIILKSNMILWNGPLGAFEYKPFDFGTNKIAEIIKKDIYRSNIITIAGGGDTLAAIKKTKTENFFSYISTAGGAFLEWLEGNESPGIIALKNNNIN